MYRHFFTAISIAAALVFLAATISSAAEATAQQELQSTSSDAIKSAVQAQADAWNKGDLDSFMTSYLRSPNTSYTSGGQEVWGYEALRERYQKRYGDNKENMGKLQFTDLKVFDTGKDSAYCIGHWHLERANLPNLDGVFSLVFMKMNDSWKIVHDHTSTLNPAAK